MTHPMPDQTDTPPTKRMTTAEVAALTQQLDGRLDDLSAVVTDLATQVQDRATAHGELRDEMMRRLSGVRSGDAPDRDQVDARIHEALAPLHQEVHELRGTTLAAVGSPDSPKLAAILARLEDVERKAATVDVDGLTAQVAQSMHPTMSNLRQRITELEADREAGQAAQADPVSYTLAEDALADQIQAAVDRTVQALMVADDNARKRLEWVTSQLSELWSAISTVDVAAPTVPPQVGGQGAARKVLQLMRMVPHIGKEKEANLGEKGGRFKFRGVDDAMDAVGHAMREVGVILGTEVLKDETTQNAITKAGENNQGRRYENTVVWTTSKLTVRYTFTDPDDGSTHSLEMVGEGRDASDKSTSKAASMALKYGLFQALMIPVTGLDESDASPPQRMEQERVQQTTTSAAPKQAEQTAQDKSARAIDALGAIRNVYRVEGGPQAQYNRLVQIMNQVKGEGLLEVTVEGSTLNQHGQAAMRTLQAPPPSGEYQPGQQELDHAARDLPSGNYPPEDDYR